MKPTLTLTPTSLQRDLGLFSPLGEMPELSPAERAERRRQFLDGLITPVPRPPRRAAHWGENAVSPAPANAAERAWAHMQAQRQKGTVLIRELLIADLTRPLLGDISAEQAEAIFTRLLGQVLERHPELNFSPADLEAALEEAYEAEVREVNPEAPANLSLQKTGQRAAEGHGPTEEPHHD